MIPQPTILNAGDKVFLTQEGYKFCYVNGLAKTLQEAQLLLSRLEIESVDIPRQRLKLRGLSKSFEAIHVFKQLEPSATDYPTVSVFPDLTVKGANALDLMGARLVKTVQPIVFGRMPMGTKKGNSTAWILLEHPQTGETIAAETTMKLFLESADKLRQFENPAGN